MLKKSQRQGSSPVVLNFQTLRNISSKLDNFKGRKILTGLISTNELLKLSNGGMSANKIANVRNATQNKKDGMISINSGIPQKIYSTLENHPDQFHLLNGGITILCDRSEIKKDNDNCVSLINPSIANGGHTHDVIRSFHNDHPNETNALCKVELIYIDHSKSVNTGLNDEISIARNQQKAVKEISIAGKRGILDDLHWLNDETIARSETDTHLFDALKLLQISFLLTPDEKWIEWEGKPLSRAQVYSSKASVLKVYRKFSSDNKNAKDYIDAISKEAKKLYHSFQNTDIFKGMLKQIKEDSYLLLDNGNFKLKDGWVLPIISSLSYFVNSSNHKVKMPSVDKLRGIIAVIFQNGYAQEKNVQLLGKNKNSYEVTLEFLGTNFDFISKGKTVFK